MDNQAEPAPEANAYELLSKPTLALTDAEVTRICADLRQRRMRYLEGQKDEPHKKPKAAPVSDEQKEANAAQLGSLLDGISI